jgi:hypothetical protein
MIICYIVAMVCILTYGLVCRWENRKRADEADTVAVGEQDWLDLTDKENKGFKYTT